MMKKILIGSLALAILAIAAGASFAGARYPSGVAVIPGSSWAGGVVGDARRSADSSQYIGCSVWAYPNGVGSSSTSCFAMDAYGNYAYCYTGSAEVARAVEGMTSDSYVSFYWDGA